MDKHKIRPTIIAFVVNKTAFESFAKALAEEETDPKEENNEYR